ncbi:ATP-dependent helicase HrpB [Telmatospirillum siberiense]|uniref:ATP-dependent helicase HrpB n=1 Tax=Telmatospirillum siberiense TaxID=382514 RepID=A0A2N3PTS8_9PROT|nr:ATP-dependent helicase HrpB [Telmatospirillum siberiense]
MNLPVETVLPSLLAALTTGPNAVLQAPPGAGKTTLVPLALLDAAWLGRHKIVMLEPRRLAARAAARRMAALLGEPLGDTVGYRIRQDSRIGPKTRIEVVTEGILTRMIQDDPSLDGIGAVIFDEFHERSLNADMGLALCLEAQAGLRPDLRLLAMSATLDGAPLARLMGDAAIVTSEGRTFPVDVRWLDKETQHRFEDAVTALIRRALAEEPEGDLLVFLPGQGEIRRVQTRLADERDDILIAPLYGDLPQDAQDLALMPQPGRRRVVLATAIAETSLTIEGISVVIDGGLMRVPRFDPNGGMARLVTVPVSKASAEQRRGRAGRLGPGVCYRLWTEASHRALPAFSTPEIGEADLAPLILELTRWGTRDPSTLSWLDPPPAAAVTQARELLHRLGALDADGRITPHGREMARLPLHPRLAHMAIKAKDLGCGALGCDLAALLSERDILKSARDADLRIRVEALRDPRGLPADRGTLQRCREAARQLRKQLGLPAAETSVEDTGLLLAFAYPDRIALCRGGDGLHYRLSNGRGAFFPQPDPLAASEALSIAELDGNRRDARIFLAAPLTKSEIETHFAEQIVTRETVHWDAREQIVAARRQRLFGELALDDSRLSDPEPGAITTAMLEGIRDMGPGCLPWTAATQTLRARLNFLHRIEGPEWPDCSDEALLANLETWLAPWLDGISRKSHLARLDMTAAIDAMLSWEARQRLDQHAPTHLTVPSGSRVPIDYQSAEQPVLAVRLQEMFGLADTPAIAGGRLKLTLHLLSPARRPVQVTQDLASFWANAYKQVKADLKGQYPKHYWPDDPMLAEPTARAKPRGT